jgi:hypothetical protein
MNKKILIVFLARRTPRLCWRPTANGSFKQSTLTYHVSHPLHQSEGVSHAAKGKGVCHAGQCDFLIAVPVKSFDSGDSNRDLHMLQVTRGAEFPWSPYALACPNRPQRRPSTPIWRFSSPARPPSISRFLSNLRSKGTRLIITGTIPATLADFKIDPPIAVDDARQERNSGARGPDWHQQ